MPDLDLLATVYDGGQTRGRAIRWIMLLAVGFQLVRRLVSGKFGPGFRRSPAGTALGLVAVVAGLVFSVNHDLGGSAQARATDMSGRRAEVVRGCTNQGQDQRVCECYGDEVLARTGHDPERFAALEREMVSRQNAGQAPPDLIVAAAQACVGRAG